MRAGGSHSCLWGDCSKQVSAHLWGCKKHWFSLPLRLRRQISAAYEPGQSIVTMSDDYRAAMAAADAFIKSQKDPELF